MTTLLAVRDLAIAFRAEEGTVEAVRGVSFDVPVGRTVALVGESGSGKTVVSQAIMGILPRTAAITAGRILFTDPAGDGRTVDLAALDPDAPARRRIRGARMSIIFQEPMSSLSPLHTIGDQVGEAYALHRRASREEIRARTLEMLGKVGFPDPERAYKSYPFELSGGLRQRAMIAMALVCEPALLIADEPTTALDVTIQAQILKLMADLQKELGIAILFITHDLGVVANIADYMVVLYRGRVMERGPMRTLLGRPQHPYLQGLLRAVPRLHTPADQPLVPLRRIASAVDTLRGRGGEDARGDQRRSPQAARDAGRPAEPSRHARFLRAEGAVRRPPRGTISRGARRSSIAGARRKGDGRGPQWAMSTGRRALARMWLVAPPKIICRSRLCV
ncbi:MAG: ABC transporter ATP-binding protein [Geminicoccaceae bacterium]|nr:ABC transporter ATP-binding protein [Geminicoccaceae bacterium]